MFHGHLLPASAKLEKFLLFSFSLSCPIPMWIFFLSGLFVCFCVCFCLFVFKCGLLIKTDGELLLNYRR